MQTKKNVLIFNLKSDLSTSLSSITKQMPLFTITIIFPIFLLIKKIKNSNNDNMNIKNPREYDKKSLNFETYIRVVRFAELSVI